MADIPVPSLAQQATFDNASMWYNFTLWTANHLGYAVNMSKLAPSLEDLVWAGPRMVRRLGSFISFPDSIDGFGQRIIPESTDMFHATTTAGSGFSGAALSAASRAAVPTPAIAAAAEQEASALMARFTFDGAKGLGSVFSYATSKWALSCIGMALILNRTHIFAATRRRPRLRWQLRLLLRIMPIVLFVFQAQSLLQSIQCQTSPDFSELRWGNSSKSSELMFSERNDFLHGLSQTLLLGASDKDSCQAVNMIQADDAVTASDLRGSLSRLWPLFGSFCLSQFVETISCAMQGRPVAAETGMTLFEHSLAFSEADAAISNQLGWGLFANGSSSAAHATSGTKIALTRSMILKRVNTPPEVLLIAFLSAMSHITSHVLGIFNVQSRFRLISTGFFGLCFMGSIFWSAVAFSVDDTSAQGLLRYPTVCIIGFIPHVLVLAGISICSVIYGLALVVSALATPEPAGENQRTSFLERLRHAHSNMQANVSLSEIRIRLDMDFYTALLRAGFGAITMASEAVYLNEDHQVNLKRYTWLEEERVREMEELRLQWIGSAVPGSRFDSIGTIGLVPIKEGQLTATSGYARERAAQNLPKNNNGARRIQDGVGAAERSGRWLMAVEYIIHINKLILTAWALAACKVLVYLGWREPPVWLRRAWQRRKVDGTSAARRSARTEQSGSSSSEWMPGRDGSIVIPRNEGVDVEYELRRRLHNQNNVTERMVGNSTVDEREVDGRLYNWWLRGGWWGSADSSGEYQPPSHTDLGLDDPDFDATSIITSTDAAESEAGWESDEGWEEGQRTPTQQSPNPFAVSASARQSRESTPFQDHPIAMTDLARLLHPSSPDERDEAHALAAHFRSDRIMTRSGYRRFQQQQRSRVVAANRQGFLGMDGAAAGKMTPEEEAETLEQILLSRRAAGPAEGAAGRSSDAAAAAAATAAGDSWSTGAAGLGPDGPQCVVCQSAPRTIIVWPCRCLSLCDDCRVSLAMNNFDKCVCCRREVISFSRIFVP